MKIKYIGNFRDGTEWAKSCTYNALALHYAGYDVYCQVASYNNQNIVIENEIEELISKECSEFDVVIQHVLPSDYKYYGGIKNIGFFEIDTLTLSDVVWIKNLNMMDHVFVPNHASQKTLGLYNIKSTIFPYTFNFDNINEQEPIAKVEELNNSFNFCFEGDFSKRKNLETVLRAFHGEFDFLEPVNLLIKINEGTVEQVSSLSDQIKGNLKKTNRYKKESVISNSLPSEVEISILKQCHCFIMPSYGDSWCYPAIQALAAGIPLVYTKGTGIDEYSEGAAIAVASKPVFCYGAKDTLQGLATCEDVWLEIDIMELQSSMRKMFETYAMENENYQTISKQCIDNASKFNYKNCEFIKGII